MLALSAPAALFAQPAAPAAVKARFTLERVGSVALLAADLAIQGRRIWIASQGGGLLAVEGGRVAGRFDVGRGLPSAIVHQVKVVSANRVLAATESGLVMIDASTGSATRVGSQSIEAAGFIDGAADVLAVSEDDGSAVFQLSLKDRGPEEGPASSLWILDRGAVERWTPISDGNAEATTAYYDTHSHCIYVAGTVAGPSSPAPWLARRCGRRTNAWKFADGAPLHSIGVAAMARDPVTKRIVVIFVTQPTGDQATRRYVAMELVSDEKLAPHCSAMRVAGAVMGLAATEHELLIAIRGDGVRPLTCKPSPPIAGKEAGPADVTALAVARDGTVWIATSTALFAVTRATGAVRAEFSTGSSSIPNDAIATDQREGRHVLLTSAATGVIELQRESEGWKILRRWTPAELPRGIYGPASFGADEEIFLIVRSRGVARYRHEQWALLGPESDLPAGHPLQLAANSAGLWIAFGGGAFDMKGAGLHLWREGKATYVPMLERRAQPTGALVPWPDGKVWVGTRVGVIEVDPSGAARRLSRNRVDSMHRDGASGAVVAVGATIERWNGSAFEPVFFNPSPKSRITGHPVDATIDSHGRMVILYSSGHIVLLDGPSRVVAVLGADEGMPPSGRALLPVPDSGEVLISSAREGLFSFKWP